MARAPAKDSNARLHRAVCAAVVAGLALAGIAWWVSSRSLHPTLARDAHRRSGRSHAERGNEDDAPPQQQDGFQRPRRSALQIEPREALADVFEEVGAVEYAFTLTNAGPAPVRITRLDPGCTACIQTRLERAELAPGQSSRLAVIYDVHAHLGPLPNRSVLVLTDEADVQPVSATVGGTRQERFVVDPPSLDFGDVLVGRTLERGLTVSVRGPDFPLDLHNLKTGIPGLTVVARGPAPQPDGGERWRLVARYAAPREPAIVEERLALPIAGNPAGGPVVRVAARVRLPVRLVPEQAFLGIVRRGETASCVIRAEPLTGVAGPCAIERSQPDTGLPGLRITVDEQNAAIVRLEAEAAAWAEGPLEHMAILSCVLNGERIDVPLRITAYITR